MGDTMTYACDWERIDSPTRGMSHADMVAYRKAHSVQGDAEFSLRDDSGAPGDIRDGWLALLADVMRAGKETLTHRQTRDELRKAWRLFADGRPYTVPTIAETPAKVRKTRGCCPQCGYSAAA